ncbi:LLM class flavin-dependent oxidoreductase [Micromonospora sp. CB01531]|uniref:LLM class flavin-dependent oxidoreductase n=1 Tax=Micromonospora sp. CB01531 TaxID=1718947 RepID=UPI00093D93FB|nr:LLM class flavin-dependent oxidoreductase [Micromonospora sp. CB01531]OKI60840.1 hypothetical protein A6A27_28990 [Micromonospora sp. CB01531]
MKDLSRQPDDRTLVRAVQQPHPPILVAGSGARMLRLAAREADIVALGMPPQSSEEQLAVKVDELRHLAGARFDDLELAVHVAAVADRLEDLPGDGRLARVRSAAILASWRQSAGLHR